MVSRFGMGFDQLSLYHNKLIRENDDFTFTEVQDSPCERLDVWRRIAEIDKNADNPEPVE